jgi:hypothetical protein
VDWAEDPATPYQDLDLESADATLVRIWTANNVPGTLSKLQAALEYADRNAEANTDYLIRVESDDDTLPRFHITANMEENVTIRLRGHGGERKLKNNNTAGSVSYNNEVNTPMEVGEGTNAAYDGGFFNIGNKNGNGVYKKLTFILEDNITVEGIGSGGSVSASYWHLIQVQENATLVMKRGSKLTGFYGTGMFIVINIVNSNKSNTTIVAEKQGAVRLEGGSITHCSFNAVEALIYCTSMVKNTAAGMLYMAGNNQFAFEENTDNTFVKYQKNDKNTDPTRSCTYALESFVASGLTAP